MNGCVVLPVQIEEHVLQVVSVQEYYNVVENDNTNEL